MSGNTISERVTGVVRSYIQLRGFGFIEGNDGRTYFVHVSDLRGAAGLAERQVVSFEASEVPKGYKALNVELCPLPSVTEQAYRSPANFIMARDGAVRGYETMYELGDGVADARDPGEAREKLKQLAIARGANAIVNLSLEKLVHEEGFTGYRYTVHRYRGNFQNVQRLYSTSVSELISRSRAIDTQCLASIERIKSEGLTATDTLTPPGPAGKYARIFLTGLGYVGRVTKILAVALQQITRATGRR